jgi:hypothetical protein
MILGYFLVTLEAPTAAVGTTIIVNGPSSVLLATVMACSTVDEHGFQLGTMGSNMLTDMSNGYDKSIRVAIFNSRKSDSSAARPLFPSYNFKGALSFKRGDEVGFDGAGRDSLGFELGKVVDIQALVVLVRPFVLCLGAHYAATASIRCSQCPPRSLLCLVGT